MALPSERRSENGNRPQGDPVAPARQLASIWLKIGNASRLPARTLCSTVVGMWLARTCAAIVLWIAAAYSMSACAVLEALEPPPLETAFSPAPPPPLPAPPQRLAPPQPAEARAEMISWLSAAGYREFQVAALVEHADAESGFRACAAGPGGFRYLFQWNGTRLKQLLEFARTSGCPQLKTQLAFADKELRNEPKFSCFWGATAEPAAYAALRRGFGRGSC